MNLAKLICTVPVSLASCCLRRFQWLSVSKDWRPLRPIKSFDTDFSGHHLHDHKPMEHIKKGCSLAAHHAQGNSRLGSQAGIGVIDVWNAE